MPYEVYRCKTQQRDILYHQHCQTLATAMATARELCFHMQPDETVLLTNSEESSVLHVPDPESPSGKDLYFPHGEPPDFDRPTAMAIFDLLSAVVMRCRQASPETVIEVVKLIETEAAKDQPGAASAMLRLVKAAIATPEPLDYP